MSIHFASMHNIIFAPLFIIIGLIAIKNCIQLLRAIGVLTHPHTQKYVFPYFSSKKQIAKTILMLSSLMFLFLAWLQPQWGKKDQTIVQEGRDLLIMLDVSRSMLAEDITPNRLDFAKLKIRNLLDLLPVERVGLILFSGTAFLQCPLTNDKPAFLMFLDQVDVHSITSGTTAIDAALQKSIDIFDESQDRKNKLGLLITDGEDFSTNLSSAKKKAEELSINLFVLGIGTKEGAPVPKFNAEGKRIGHETDESGAIVLTKLNESLLQDICSNLNGTYVSASYDNHDISQVVGFINRFEKERFNEKQVSLYEEQYYWFLGIAWLLLALEWVL